jgi:hypothetical protein
MEEDVENLEPFCIASGNVKRHSHVENSLAVFQKAKYKITI